MVMNKDLFVDGKAYISASRAAEKIGYAGDYVGQLCRSGAVPAKLIGRSWYVDFEALTEYKKTHKTRSARKQAFLRKTTATETRPIPAVQSASSPEYVPEFSSKLPELKKAANKTLYTGPLHNLVVTVLTLSLVAYIGLSWFEYVAPASEINTATAQENLAASGAASFANYAYENISLGAKNAYRAVTTFGGVTIAGKAAKNPARGVVVTPDQTDHDALVGRVKDSFSDPVNVTLDAEGDSGVVTPVFHAGDDTENYAFVLVPIKQ